MSANMEDFEHFHAMLTAAISYRDQVRWAVDDSDEARAELDDPASGLVDFRFGGLIRTLTKESASRVGQILVSQNLASVNARYSEEETVSQYVYKRSLRPWGDYPVEILKAIHGYEYQACETRDFPETEAYRICRAIEKAMIGRLPGYSESEAWSINRSTLTEFDRRSKTLREKRDREEAEKAARKEAAQR
jgi:hypothetical protein